MKRVENDKTNSHLFWTFEVKCWTSGTKIATKLSETFCCVKITYKKLLKVNIEMIGWLGVFSRHN